MKIFRISLAGLLFGLPFFLWSQITAPEWVRGQNLFTGDAYLIKTCQDNEGNFYMLMLYSEKLALPDTSFIHKNFPDYSSQAVLIKTDRYGQYLKSIDIYSPHPVFGMLDRLDMQTDEEGNLFIGGSFVLSISISEYMLYAQSQYVYASPEVFMAKIKPDLTVDWSYQVSGPQQDDFGGFVVSGSHIYFHTGHYINTGGPTGYVRFADSDSVWIDDYTHFIGCLDSDRNLVWLKQINRCHGPYSFNLICAPVQKGTGIDFFFTTNTSLCWDSDSIYVEDSNSGRVVWLHAGNNGDITEKGTLPQGVDLTQVMKSPDGKMYFMAFLGMNCAWGNFNLICQPDSTNFIIGRLDDGNQPVWLDVLRQKHSSQSSNLSVSAGLYGLDFSFDARHRIKFFGQILPVGNLPTVISGRVSPEGALQSIRTDEGTMGMRLHGLCTTTCSEGLMVGKFVNKVFLGPDTLYAPNSYTFQGFTGLLDYGNGPVLTMVSDTSGCDSVILMAPAGWTDYRWNNGQTYGQHFVVRETGWQHLEVADANHCWRETMIWAEVRKVIPLDVCTDTSIFLTDSLVLQVPDGYSNILWSNQSQSVRNVIRGSDLGLGDHAIWVIAEMDGCQTEDRFTITVKSGEGIFDDFRNGIVFPNPAGNKVYIAPLVIPKRTARLMIGDVFGKTFLNARWEAGQSALEADVSNLKPGLYSVILFDDDSVIFHSKLIIIR
jgi:hypothetical protein